MKVKKIYLLIFVIIVLMIFFGYTMMRLINANKECNENPFTYGARLMNQKETPILCACNSFDGEISFWYDEKGMYADNPLIKIEEREDSFDYSKIEMEK